MKQRERLGEKYFYYPNVFIDYLNHIKNAYKTFGNYNIEKNILIVLNDMSAEKKFTKKFTKKITKRYRIINIVNQLFSIVFDCFQLFWGFQTYC